MTALLFGFQSWSDSLHWGEEELGVKGHTSEKVLGAEVADAEPQDGQLVQAGDHVLGEGKQGGQAVQLRVQAVAVAFGRVGLGAFGWGRFYPGSKTADIMMDCHKSNDVTSTRYKQDWIR